MINDVNQRAKYAQTRLRNILSRGILTGLKPAKTPTITATVFDDETIEGIEFAQDFGFISSPPVDGGTELIIAFLGGARDSGTVVKAFNKAKALNIPLLEGECAIYNKVTDTYIRLKQNGEVFIKSATSIKLDAPTVTITGNLLVNGDITDKNLTNSRTVKGMRDVYNTHTHLDPQGGSVAAPTQGM